MKDLTTFQKLSNLGDVFFRKLPYGSGADALIFLTYYMTTLNFIRSKTEFFEKIQFFNQSVIL